MSNALRIVGDHGVYFFTIVGGKLFCNFIKIAHKLSAWGELTPLIFPNYSNPARRLISVTVSFCWAFLIASANLFASGCPNSVNLRPT